jgi:hypothetical protein
VSAAHTAEVKILPLDVIGSCPCLEFIALRLHGFAALSYGFILERIHIRAHFDLFGDNQVLLSLGNFARCYGCIQTNFLGCYAGSLVFSMLLVENGLDICRLKRELANDLLYQA